MGASIKPEPVKAAGVPNTSAIETERDFVEGFSKKLAEGNTPQDRGRARGEREARENTEAGKKKEEPAPKTKSGQSKAGTKTDEGTRGEDAEESDEIEGDAESEDQDDESPDDEENGESEAEGEKDEEAVDEEDEEAGDDEDDEEEGSDESDDTLARSARAELERHGVKVTLDDLPKEARPLVKRRLAEMEAGFTRAVMDQRSYRREEAAYRTERAFTEQHPEYVIAELLEKGGAELEEKVNKLLNEASTDTSKEALRNVTKGKRDAVLKSITDQAEATQRVNSRADEIEQYARAACRKLNVPFEIVEEAIANRLLDKPEDKRDLTDTELDAIIGRQRNILRKHLGEKRLGQRKTEIQGRRKDQRSTSPAAKGGNSKVAPGPATVKPPANDEEFTSLMVGKLQSGAASRR